MCSYSPARISQSFGFCDILFSASLALAAPAANAAMTPKQVASSTLRITKPPTLFQVYLFARWGLLRQHQPLLRNAFPKRPHFRCVRPSTPTRRRQIQRTEVQLKPETTKCYARQMRGATENTLQPVCFACCDANMRSD